jgi:hypothetical protein
MFDREGSSGRMLPSVWKERIFQKSFILKRSGNPGTVAFRFRFSNNLTLRRDSSVATAVCSDAFSNRLHLSEGSVSPVKLG